MLPFDVAEPPLPPPAPGGGEPLRADAHRAHAQRARRDDGLGGARRRPRRPLAVAAGRRPARRAADDGAAADLALLPHPVPPRGAGRGAGRGARRRGPGASPHPGGAAALLQDAFREAAAEAAQQELRRWGEPDDSEWRLDVDELHRQLAGARTRGDVMTAAARAGPGRHRGGARRHRGGARRRRGASARLTRREAARLALGHGGTRADRRGAGGRARGRLRRDRGQPHLAAAHARRPLPGRAACYGGVSGPGA